MGALRFAYNTNGLAHHRLPDAIDLLADLGYDGIALTPEGAVGGVRYRDGGAGAGATVSTGTILPNAAPQVIDRPGRAWCPTPSATARMRELGLRRMFLHAHSLAFTWPDTGSKCRIVAPLPADLRAVVERLGEKKSG